MPNTYVNINTDNNIVAVESSNESIRIINNDSGATVNIVKVDRDVVRVNGIGPQGPQGADGGGINTGSLAITGSNTFIGNQIINGNLTVTGSLFATASYSTYAVTASYALNAAAGTQGTIGSQGANGTSGSNGTQGATGTQGFNGTQGPLGSQGIQGTLGAQGAAGVQGRQGTIGAQGTTGTQGTDGAQGTIGAQGSIGVQGTNASTSITNNVNNYVVTATGNPATPFNGESGLQYDGSLLEVSGAIQITGASGLIIYSGANPTSSIAIGNGALYYNVSGRNNLAIGPSALQENKIGDYNVGIGERSILLNGSGSYNTAVGYGSLGTASGSYNTGVGFGAGDFGGVDTATSHSIYIGYQANPYGNNESNQIVIGSTAIGNGSNTTVIGTANTISTRLFGTVTGSNIKLTTIPVTTTQTRVLVSDTNGNIFYRTTVPTASIAQTASYVVTALSASYVNPLTQTLRVTGSVFGNVTALSIASNTASLNLTSGSFFTLQLVQGTNTYINPNSISPGLAVSLLISTTGSATVSFPATVFQPSGSSYTPTTTTGKDVLTLLSFDSTNLYLANVKNLI
jgi:hypothetical protein